MEKNIIQLFNLPSYVKDKSFADASKSINKKFDGRNDRISTETKEELLQRLAKAQEYLKEQSAIGQSDTNQAFFGGPQDATGEVTKAEGGMGDMGGIDYMSLASGALDIGQNLFGKTGIDTSGAAGEMQKQNKTGAAISGAMSGAKAGMALGPVGAGVGALVGGAANLFGANKANKEIQEANNNNALKINSQYNSNFAKGGNMYIGGGSMGDCGGPGQPPCKDVSTYADGIDANFLQQQIFPSYGSNNTLLNPNSNRTSNNSKPKTQKDLTPNLNRLPNDLGVSYADQGNTEVTSSSNIGKQFVPTESQTKLMNKVQRKENFNENLNDVLQYGKENYGNALRYAPAVMNALQLKNLDKPEYESLDRLDNRYNKDLVDESALRNTVQQQSDNARNAITNASTGSVGATRANLLGSQANSTNALSNAMLQAENVNRGENQAEQQFNLGVDSTNLQQSNAENQINAQNKGVYDTNKSQLLGQIGNDIGNIGKEEKYKQMIKDMGVCYDSRGAYICGTQERVPNGMDTSSQTNQSAYGGDMNSNSLFTSYLDTILSKKK